MGVGGLLKKFYHIATGVSEGKINPNFVPFMERNPTPAQVAERQKYLREKYLWKAKDGWGVGGLNQTFKTEAAALVEAERFETDLERTH